MQRLRTINRHFVGWCRFAEITLGTNEQRYGRLVWSEASPRPNSVAETTTTLGLSLTLHGMGFSASRTYKRGRNEKSPFENHEENYRLAILNARLSPVLLYCWSRRQAWLVPQTSVLLQLLLMWCAFMNENEPGSNIPLHYAEATSDGGNAAYEVLKEHGADVLPLGDQDNPNRVLKVVRMFLFALQKLNRRANSLVAGPVGWEWLTW